MKILIIHNQYLSIGGEDFIVDQITRLLATRHETQCLIRCSKEWKEPGAPPSWKQPFLLFHNPVSLQEIEALHHSFKPDIWLIHNTVPVISLGVYELAYRLGAKVVQYLHNYRPFSPSGTSYANGKPLPLKSDWAEIQEETWQNSPLKTAFISSAFWKLRHSQAYQSIHRWIALSDFQKNKMIEAGLPADRTDRLYHSWNLIVEDTKIRDLGYYLFLGRLTEEKGIRTLLQTWKMLCEKGDTSRLIICGEGPLEKTVREAAILNPQIEFRGSISGETKSKLLSECRALIAPSLWWEPLGLIVYEAYQYHKPVFAARSGGLQETVLHQKTGFLHEPENSQELCNQILTFNHDPQRFSFTGEKGNAWLQENTNPNKWLDSFEKIIF